MAATLVSAVARHAAARPDHLAVIASSQTVTFGELLVRTRRGATRLRRSGVVPGDRVVLSASHSLDFVDAYLATHWLGAVAVPLDPQATTANVERIVERVTPRAVFLANPTPDLTAEPIAHFIAECEPADVPCGAVPDALADVVFTTGTTGQPKGVMLTQGNLLAAATNINAFIGNDGDDREVLPMPLSHSFGLGRLRCNLLAGGTLLLADGLFQLRPFFALFDRWRPTGLASVSAGFVLLLKLTKDKLGEYADTLRYIEIGSAPMAREHKEQLMRLLPKTRLCMHYGLTEASRAAFLEFHTDRDRLDSVGRASPNVAIRIMTRENRECAPGEAGEIQVRGGMVMRGYWQDRGLTESVCADGWLRTGDLGHRDAEGYVYLDGRESDLINVGGRKVAPAEVETALAGHPAVAECACVGVPDPDGVAGQAIRAFLVPRGGLPRPEAAEWNAYLRDRLEPYKFPRDYVWVRELTKTSSGKIQRQRLSEATRI